MEYFWGLCSGSLVAVSEEDSARIMRLDEVAQKATYVLDSGGVGLGGGDSVRGLARRPPTELRNAVLAVLPQLKKAEEENQKRWQREAAATDRTRTEAHTQRHAALVAAWGDKDVTALNQLLGLETGSFDELATQLKTRGIRTTSTRYGRRGEDPHEIVTTRWEDPESGWQLQWEEIGASWSGRD